jgi:hypothetical protein
VLKGFSRLRCPGEVDRMDRPPGRVGLVLLRQQSRSALVEKRLETGAGNLETALLVFLYQKNGCCMLDICLRYIFEIPEKDYHYNK